MLQVWPSIWRRSVASCLHRRDRLVEHPRRFGPQRVAVEVEVHVLERVRLDGGGRVTWMLTVSDAVLSSLGHVTVTVTGTVPFLLRRRPQRLPLGRVRQRARSAPSSDR